MSAMGYKMNSTIIKMTMTTTTMMMMMMTTTEDMHSSNGWQSPCKPRGKGGRGQMLGLV
jgi:hypothetical protein